MRRTGWADCPEPIRSQVEEFLIGLKAISDVDPAGIYLHGSLAFGCFNPDSSDIDLLIVTRDRMTLEARRQVAGLLLRVSGRPRPIEITFVTQSALRSGVYPVPFDLHYGEDWRQKTEEDLANGAWRYWNDTQHHDPDLAGQIAVARARGVCLSGEPVESLPLIPREVVLDSFLADCEWSLERLEADPVYGILNPCRSCAYLMEDRFYSKEEGGEWAVARFPEPYRSVIAQALEIYIGSATDRHFDAVALQHFATYVRKQIAASLKRGE